MMRIVIVDDHPIVREGLKTILQDDPEFEVVAESGSAEGLAGLVQRTRPDVVLLDARLPGVSGAEAGRQLVAANPDLAVLMVSSYTDDRLVEECIRAGAKGYLIKDIQRLSLKKASAPSPRGAEPYPPPSPPRSLTACARTKTRPQPSRQAR